MTTRAVIEKLTSHPWMTERFLYALSAMHGAEGIVEYGVECCICLQVLEEDFDNYVSVVKKRFSCLPFGFKLFWFLCRKFLLGLDKAAIVPSLRRQNLVLGVVFLLKRQTCLHTLFALNGFCVINSKT